MVRGENRPADQAPVSHPLLRLQQVIGNQMVGRLLQPKLNIGQPHDAYEQEADRLAEQVLRPPSPSLQVQRRLADDATSGTTAPPIVEEVLREPGRPLTSDTRRFMESYLGHDLASVRVYAGAKAAQSARAVNAQAYTVGHHVVFGSGQYAPDTPVGRRLLAHELVHVVQQTGAGATPTLQREPQGAGSSQAAGATPAKEEEDTAKIITGGLEIVAKQLDKNNPQFKKVKDQALDTLKDEARGVWNRLAPAEKGITLGFAGLTLGTLGATLSDEKARTQFVNFLEGKNVALPLQLIPHMPLKGFSFKRPEAGAGPGNLLQIDTRLTATPLMEWLRRRHPDLPPIAVDVGLNFGYNPAARDLQLTGGTITVGLFKGIGITAGTFKEISPLPEIVPTVEGGFTTTVARLPKPEPLKIGQGFQFVVSVDLLKLDLSIFSSRTQQILRALR
jgi:hypothetical protein